MHWAEIVGGAILVGLETALIPGNEPKILLRLEYKLFSPNKESTQIP